MKPWSSPWAPALVLLLSAITTPATAAVDDADACTVKELKKSAVQGLKVYAPDHRRYVINKEDEKKIAQMYVGQDGSDALTCITCVQRPGGPQPKRFKMQPHWHPSGKWIIMAAEREKYSPPPVLGWSRKYVEGQLQNGIWTNMYAVTPDGQRWVRLTDFKSGAKGTSDGYTGPSFTSDGRKVVWSQAADGNVFKYWPFGRWELIIADVNERDGMPSFRNLRNITPAGMHWNEPGNFAPDNETMLVSGSTEKDAQGMDQYTLNIRTGALTNLTNSPKVWDEHGLFSPDGKKIMWMSAYPYRNDEKASKVTSIKTEFMLMDRDGTGLKQLTRFREPGAPEYPSGIAANPEWFPDGRGANLLALVFPKFEYWDVIFEGACGKS
jgi:hypothetical protein